MLEFFATLHWGAVLQIIIIDLLLGGDNAVVIALACRKLPANQRFQGILWGTVGALVLRAMLAAFAVTLLDVPLLKLAGGILLIWIGVRLVLPERESHGKIEPSERLFSAIKTILIADLVMSLDNVIAIAGAAAAAPGSHRQLLVVFGLIVSVPIIVWGSQLVLKALDRFPIIILFGAALLGWIAGGLILHDSVFPDWPELDTDLATYIAGVVGAVFVVALGLLARRRMLRRQVAQ